MQILIFFYVVNKTDYKQANFIKDQQLYLKNVSLHAHT